MFALVSAALLMTSIDQTIVATALGAIKQDLHTQVNWAAWTITVYSLGRVLAVPLVGRLSDEYDRRRVFICAVTLFTAASAACAIANSIGLLIALRAIQAVGGAGFMPSATGLVADTFGPDRDKAVGLFTSINPIGAMIGPVFGGLFVTYWSWRGIFIINIPIGVVLVLLATRLLPKRSQPSEFGADDLNLVEMALLAAGILSGMLAITYLGNAGASPLSPWFLVPALICPPMVVGFLIHSRRSATPFIEPRLLHGRQFGPINLINFVYGAAALGFGALVPLYATDRYGIASLASGTLLTARAVGIILVSGVAAMLLRRTGYRWPMAVGFLLAGGGLTMMALPATSMSPFRWLAVASALTGAGMGLATPSSNNASLQLAPGNVAAITGLRNVFRHVGSITAVSVSTAVVASSADPGIAQARSFVVLAGILVLCLPLIRMVPEHRGGW